jgi:hypothetical protein
MIRAFRHVSDNLAPGSPVSLRFRNPQPLATGRGGAGRAAPGHVARIGESRCADRGIAAVHASRTGGYPLARGLMVCSARLTWRLFKRKGWF